MSAPVVCVPSYRRPEALAARTWPLLERLGAAATAEVWLSDPAEASAYIAAGIPADRLHAGRPTLSWNRQLIMRGHAGDRVVFADDDLDDLRVLGPDGRLASATAGDWQQAVDAGFMACALAGARLWGVAPVANPYFMSTRTVTGRCFCIGSLYGLDVPADPEPYVTRNCEKEDYERSLRAWEQDGCVVRLNWLSPKTTYYRGGGGMVDGRTVELQEGAVQFIEQRWPGATRRNAKRNSPYPEIIIKPRKGSR